MKNTIRFLAVAAVAATLGTLTPRSAHAEDYSCQPTLIKDHGDATVVWCKTAYSGTSINGIALPNSHARIASFVSLAQMALLSGRSFLASIDTAPRSTDSYWGCFAATCRPVTRWFGAGTP